MASNLPPDPIYVLRGSTAPISCITFFPPVELTITTLASGNHNGQVMIWNLKIRGVAKQWNAHPTTVLWLRPIADHLIWTQGRNHSIILWDFGDEKPAKLYEYQMSEYLGFSSCSLTKDNNFIAIPGPRAAEVSVLDVDNRCKLVSFLPDDGDRGMVMSIKWVDGGIDKNLVIAYESGHISLWNIKQLSIISEIKLNNTPICLTISKTSNIGLCGTSCELELIHLFPKKSLCFVNSIAIKNEGISCCCFRPDGKIYASGGWDHRVRLFSTNKNKALAVLNYHKDTIECIEFSDCQLESFPIGSMLACGSSDHSISLWNIFNR